MRKARVTGEICLPVDARVNAKSLVRVQLLDTSLADAPALEVACQKIGGIEAKLARREMLRFDLTCDRVDPHASYSVQVHVDQNGDGNIKPGDFVNLESCPVITYGYPETVQVQTNLVT